MFRQRGGRFRPDTLDDAKAEGAYRDKCERLRNAWRNR